MCVSVHKTAPLNRTQTMWFHSSSFTGKERDEETGFGYFGARYMDHELMTMWLSVDPMADKYPNISPYAYCNWNPVRLVDPDGEEISPIFSTEGKLLGTDNTGYGGIAIVMDKNKFSPNMSHEEAKKKGQFLNKYGEGISISDNDWDKVVSEGGKRLTPSVSNESDHTIYYKPEGIKDGEDMNPGYSASEAYPIAPHTDLYASTDGVTAPHIKKNVVFKIPDGLKVRVTNQSIHRRLKTFGLGWCASFIPFLGGWNGGLWHDYLVADCISIPTISISMDVSKQVDYSWNHLFEKSR